MTVDEEKELWELRAYRQRMEATRNERAFKSLQDLLDNVRYDPICSPKAFRVLAECILGLREELKCSKHMQ